MTETFQGTIGRTYRESQAWWPEAGQAPTGAPNVVMIVLDDVGFSDIGCYGSSIETPNIDALAADGLRFNNFHTTALCSPTRACLLTGRNHHAVGMGVVANWDTGFPGYRGRLDPRSATLAEVLRDGGYNTFAVGKWHLTPPEETSSAGPYDQWPLQRGFDRFYGFLDGGVDQFSPELVVDNHRIDAPRRPEYHVAEDLVDQATAMIRGQRSAYPEKPFFLYLCFGTAHYPLQAPAAYREKYRGRFDHGWDAERADRLARQIDLGIVPAGTGLAPPNEGVAEWGDLSPAEQQIAARLQETYAGFLDHTDEQIGRLVAELHRVDAYDDTLFLFLSDNGATSEGGRLGSVNFMAYTNGRTPNSPEELLARLDEIGGPTTSPMYPAGWAMAGNTPLKRYKMNVHSGGIRDPFIVAWPRRLTDAGAIRSQFHHAVDVAPTVLELANLTPPTAVRGIEQLPLDGASMVGSIADAVAPSPRTAQYFEMFGNRAIWADGWKAVSYHRPGTDFDEPWELYHLDEDFAELLDLAAEHPERLTELAALWEAEARRNQVFPLDDRVMERFLVPKPRPMTARSRFVYYDGASIPAVVAPDVRDVSYRIRAEVDLAGDGTIVSCGDRFCGYALCVIDGHLVHDYNAAGTHQVVRSMSRVAPGRRMLEYRFAKTGELRGDATLHVDGREIGACTLEDTLRVHVAPACLTIGRSPVSAVGGGYEAPFRFAGRIDQVVFEMGDDSGAMAPDELGPLDD